MRNTWIGRKCPLEGLNLEGSVLPSYLTKKITLIVFSYVTLECKLDMIITQQSSTNPSPFRDNTHELFQFSNSGPVCCGIMAELTQVWERGVNSLPAQLKLS